MKGRDVLYPFILAVLLGMSPALMAQADQPTPAAQPVAKEKVADATVTATAGAEISTENPNEFVKETLADGMYEIRLAEVAMERSSDPQIDQLAKTIKSDHAKANSELKNLATVKKWETPATITDDHQDKIENLQEADAEDVDRKYLELTEDAHRIAIRKLESCRSKKEDPQLTAWIDKTLPVLQKHLDTVKTLEDVEKSE